MNALLLSAGEGRRLWPLTLTTPKCLVPILGRPLMWFWFRLLREISPLQNCWINTSYLSEPVTEFVETYRGQLPFSVYTFYEKELLGTGGTLRALWSKFTSDDLLLLHADNLSWFRPDDFLFAHKNRPAETDITMMTFHTDSPQTCGIIEVDSNNVAQHFYEKDPQATSNLANGAVYLISPLGLEKMRALGDFNDFSTQVIPAFMGKIYCWHNNTYHRDIGNPDSYRLAQSEFQPIATEFDLFTK